MSTVDWAVPSDAAITSLWNSNHKSPTVQYEYLYCMAQEWIARLCRYARLCRPHKCNLAVLEYIDYATDRYLITTTVPSKPHSSTWVVIHKPRPPHEKRYQPSRNITPMSTGNTSAKSTSQGKSPNWHCTVQIDTGSTARERRFRPKLHSFN